MKYILLLTIWNLESPDVYFLESGLSGQDCIARLESMYAIQESGLGELACVVDHPATFMEGD